MFRTIIVKTFHRALDVMFATASYRIGRKGFVACSRKNSDKLQLQGFVDPPSPLAREAPARKRVSAGIAA